MLAPGRILLLRDDADDLEYYDPVMGAVEPVQAERLVRTLRASAADPVAFSPTGQWALSIEGSKLAVWNIATGELERSLAHASGMIGGAVFSPDGSFLATDGGNEEEGEQGGSPFLGTLDGRPFVFALTRVLAAPYPWFCCAVGNFYCGC